MSSRTVVTSFPISGLLGVAFVVLKLTGVIAWSWWWVLAPFWAPVTVAVILMLLIAVAMGLASKR
jgi:hypothetical protein